MILKDIVVEKTVTEVCPPMSAGKLASSKMGFPEAPTLVTVASNSVAAEAGDLRLTERDLAKLEWTDPVEDNSEPSSSVRYDFEGNEVVSEEQYKSELYHHGNEPGKPGYTLEELFHLTQSGFQSQKALAIRAIGAIAERMGGKGRKSKREFHRVLIGEWKSHVRFSVACSDTSVNVRTAAWLALLQLITGLDRECGCVARDLASIPEFFRAFSSDDKVAVKVFLYIIHSFTHEEELEEVHEIISDSVLGAAEKFNLEPNDFMCGVTCTGEQVKELLDTETSPAAEIIATLCDRTACIATEPLSKDDVELFYNILGSLKPSAPFFEAGQVDEFSWTSRSNMVSQALTEFTGDISVSVFLAKLCWIFTSALFPVECRAAIWGNSELVGNMSRLICSEGENRLDLLGNHKTLDFACGDIGEISRDNSMLLRSMRSACKKFIDEFDDEGSVEMRNVAKAVVSKLESA
jgi:hypothetical protein